MPTMMQLAAMIQELCPRDGSHGTEIDGLFLTRSSTTEVPRTSLHKAVFCVVAQGAKSTLLNEKRFLYDSNKYLLVSLDLPLVGQIEEASSAKPFLGLSLVLDFEEIASLLREADLPPESALPPRPSLMIGSMDNDLLDAVIRLTALLKKPAQIAVLAPLVRREIFYKLLLSEQGGLLCRMVADYGKIQRVAAGLAWLRLNVARPIRMEELAREMRMSPSAMHDWFRAVTSMSPLQYQNNCGSRRLVVCCSRRHLMRARSAGMSAMKAPPSSAGSIAVSSVLLPCRTSNVYVPHQRYSGCADPVGLAGLSWTY